MVESRIMRGAAMMTVFFLNLAAANGENAFTPMPGREISLPKSEIKDIFLGYLIGLIDADMHAVMSQRDLSRAFPEFEGNTTSPFRLLEVVARDRPDNSANARLFFTFGSPLHVPVPFRILWYHPIFINTSDTVVLGESRALYKIIRNGPNSDAFLSPYYEYRVERGSASVEVDEWLVALTAGILSDFSVKTVALFKRQGEWYGLIAGKSRKGRVVSWLFSLTRLWIVFPMPEVFSVYAAELVNGE